MELKDEHKASEPPEKVMCQALVYAVFVAHLLLSEYKCEHLRNLPLGFLWNTIFRTKGDLELDWEKTKQSRVLPKTLYATVLMPMPPDGALRVSELEKKYKYMEENCKYTLPVQKANGTAFITIKPRFLFFKQDAKNIEFFDSLAEKLNKL